jgi:DNA mismatch repair protein MutH
VRAAVSSPATIDELSERALRLGGRTVGDLAGELGVPVPDTLSRAKGFVGGLLERALGVTAVGDEVDFPHLGVELKSVPVDRAGVPRESTYVCRVSYRAIARESWPSSRVRAKLSRVMFVPIEADPAVAIRDRRIGRAVEFALEGEMEETLAADWTLLAGRLGAGQDVTAREGRYLQLRPKAPNGRTRSLAPASDGGSSLEIPRGFYLRAAFTRELFARYLASRAPEPALAHVR